MDSANDNRLDRLNFNQIKCFPEIEVIYSTRFLIVTASL